MSLFLLLAGFLAGYQLAVRLPEWRERKRRRNLRPEVLSPYKPGGKK